MAATNTAVEKAVEALTQAMISAERAELERWTAEELIYGHSTGRKETQREFIEGGHRCAGSRDGGSIRRPGRR